MRRFIKRKPEKQDTDQNTSTSLGTDLPTTGCPALFDGVQTPTIFVLPQPPLIYQMNPNQQQPDYSEESYKQSSAQTDLVIGECLSQPDQPKQSSLVYIDKFSQGETVQTSQLSTSSAPQQPQELFSGQAPSSGQPSSSSGQPPPFPGQPPPSSGQPPTYSVQPPHYVGQPPPYAGAPGAYQPYFGPYYSTPPSVYRYSAHAPVQSAAGKKIIVFFYML